MMIRFYTASALASTFSLALGQSYTSCDPLVKTCPADPRSTESQFQYDFTSSSDLQKWNTASGTIISGSNGAEFTINEKGDAPTIETNFYIFFGEVEVEMKAAPGTGIVSAVILESDDLDEIDWPIPQVQMDLDPGESWLIDGKTVRTLTYEEAVHGTRYPQSLMRARIGNWAGGDPDNNPGTVEWAGGQTDFSQGPFTMYVKSVSIFNYNPTVSYSYNGDSGSMQDIEIYGATSTSTIVPGEHGGSGIRGTGVSNPSSFWPFPNLSPATASPGLMDSITRCLFVLLWLWYI
ncbi:concanavalin A-like lectin/glucanase [Aspergillus affinis]|uniref:concanavalin A-like lectin/glucanase n=1 Tax=Aspergillus affinis TaxID=1070780 RepID=UPI0022FE5411|nr:concanavalin A-like lectin/glucanase [Aspergillus affinis]KAI9045438.1 concanavalin A-like lectin/glucanase [Aspergillus affinis]